MPSADLLENIEATLGLISESPRRTADPDEEAEDDGERTETPSVLGMIKADPHLTPAQRRALTEIYVAMIDVTRSRRST